MIKVIIKTIHHFSPELSRWLNKVGDPRVKKTTYILSHLLWIAILLFLIRLGSKRQIKYLLSTDEFKENLKLIIIFCRGSLSQKFNAYNYANESVFCDKIKKSLIGAGIYTKELT